MNNLKIHIFFLLVSLTISCKNTESEKQITEYQTEINKLRNEMNIVSTDNRRLKQSLDSIKNSPTNEVVNLTSYCFTRILYSVDGDIRAYVSDIQRIENLNEDKKFKFLDEEEHELNRKLIGDKTIVKRDFYTSNFYAEMSTLRQKKDGVSIAEIEEQRRINKIGY